MITEEVLKQLLKTARKMYDKAMKEDALVPAAHFQRGYSRGVRDILQLIEMASVEQTAEEVIEMQIGVSHIRVEE